MGQSEPISTPGANWALALVSFSVLLGTSTWFTGAVIAPALISEWALSEGQAALLTTTVQAGFVVGTLLYAATNLADVFNPRIVFFLSAGAGAAFNLAFALWSDTLWGALALRFLTGVTFAGVYPVGMRIVAGWFRDGLGWRLGVLVGALTVGTASPWVVRALGADLSWRPVAAIASGAALLGGMIVLLLVREGPLLRKRARFDARMMLRVFAHRPFRLAAFGYFGHMWELYAFWAMVAFYLGAARLTADSTPLIAFGAIAAGGLGCVAGGWVSRSVGERRVALFSLCASAMCCLLSPWMAGAGSIAVVAFVLVWGFFVVADSPQFSALAARLCPPEYTGTALTVQVGIGFLITVASIQLLPVVAEPAGWRWAFLALAAGPLLGAVAMHRLKGAMAASVVPPG